MKTSHCLWFSMIFTLILLAPGCVSNEEDKRRDHELQIIQEYLNANNITDESKTEGGIYFIGDTTGNAASPEEGNYVIISYVGRFLENMNIRETSYDSLKSQWSAAASYKNYLYGPIMMPLGKSITGINEGLALMKEGGKATLIIPSEKAFYDYTPLIYEIRLHKVVDNPVTYSKSLFKTFLTANNFTEILSDSVFYKEIVTPPEDTVTPVANDEIYFRFAGLLIDEFRNALNDTFDTNFPLSEDQIKFIWGKTKISAGDMISTSAGIPAGLRLALGEMRKGTRALVAIPYSQAFGKDGLVDSRYGFTIIPAYQNVVYEIVVDDIVTP
ncbi:MAG: FKBP-type peptidyl-prolyl cis-trans isomerase [Bacteroidales bacterium]